MSFSNTNTGSKPADPVTAANLDNDVPLKVRVEDLESFIKSTNFGMLTTRAGDSGQLVSRCMGVAATVRNSPPSAMLSLNPPFLLPVPTSRLT